jgi:hypothetical protein
MSADWGAGGGQLRSGQTHSSAASISAQDVKVLQRNWLRRRTEEKVVQGFMDKAFIGPIPLSNPTVYF